jgi:NitT/TauT family transport system ATP-binding protein
MNEIETEMADRTVDQIAQAAAGKGRIDVRNFSLSYETIDGSVDAVTDTQIHVNPGEFVSIVGPSGCGKSTLLNAVAGFLKPTTGTVAVDGEEVKGPSAERGMVFQQYSLFPWKTVRENVEFGMKMRGMGRSARERAARTLLGLAGLGAFEKHYPDRLSGGMKQRVGIVRALATGPKVLLLDEPFGALDAQTRVIMQQILTNMWQRLKISVLFVTHDIDEAIFLSDRVYCMTARPGSIKAEIPIPLERPRQQSMMMSSEFLALRRGLMSLIREESLKAMGGEITDLGMQGLSIELNGQSLAECSDARVITFLILRALLTGNPYVALLDLPNKGLGIKFPEAGCDLEQLRRLWLVPNVVDGDDRAVVGFDSQRKFSLRIDPADEFPARGRDRTVGDGASPVDRLLAGTLAAPIALIR